MAYLATLIAVSILSFLYVETPCRIVIMEFFNSRKQPVQPRKIPELR